MEAVVTLDMREQRLCIRLKDLRFTQKAQIWPVLTEDVLESEDSRLDTFTVPRKSSKIEWSLSVVNRVVRSYKFKSIGNGNCDP